MVVLLFKLLSGLTLKRVCKIKLFPYLVDFINDCLISFSGGMQVVRSCPEGFAYGK
jgi:hypothetical protein